ncbi:unnamed protein product [Polarella glacialis]|uniref:Uncharacterized protein n=1 Tax=Polarella glacialis TaxID=89957 RepID=A0A813EE13_POLGL|nr:unnamed protein product [Polarella glacialis]CAE8644596.1 unnamed protein product [Polarella glacialis]
MVKDELMGTSVGEALSLRNWARRVRWEKFRRLRRRMKMLIAIQDWLKLGLPGVAREGEMSASPASLGAMSDLNKKIKGGNTRADQSSGSGVGAEAELTGAVGEQAVAEHKKKKRGNKKGAQKGKKDE